ncbi:hypothetical protein Tco_0595885 [Tanacetum coccineum]
MRLRAKRKPRPSARGTIEIGVDQKVCKWSNRHLNDHMVEISFHRVIVIESFQSDQGHRIMATSQQSAAMSERIGMLEWDNMEIKHARWLKADEMTHVLAY